VRKSDDLTKWKNWGIMVYRIKKRQKKMTIRKVRYYNLTELIKPLLKRVEPDCFLERKRIVSPSAAGAFLIKGEV